MRCLPSCIGHIDRLCPDLCTCLEKDSTPFQHVVHFLYRCERVSPTGLTAVLCQNKGYLRQDAVWGNNDVVMPWASSCHLVLGVLESSPL